VHGTERRAVRVLDEDLERRDRMHARDRTDLAAPAIAPDLDRAVVAEAHADHPLARRLHGELHRDQDRGAIAEIAIRETEPEVWVGRDSEPPAMPAHERAERGRRLPGIGVTHEQAHARRDEAMDAVARVESAPVVGVTPFEAEWPVGVDFAYAPSGMDDAERERVRDAEPDVGRERGPLPLAALLVIERRRELDIELAGLEHDGPADDVIGVGVRDTREQHHQSKRAHVATLALALSGCLPPLSETGSIYYDGDARRVHCGANIDSKSSYDTAAILEALDAALERDETLEVYTHKPGVTITLERLEAVFAHAQEIGLPFVTYAELARRRGGAGIALGFDDSDIYGWTSIRPLFATYGVHATFFISRYPYFDDEMRGLVAQLAADGHDIAAHTVDHKNGPAYVEEFGLTAYVREQVLPSIELLRADGYTVTSLAYPFGQRTSETDDAILEHVDIVRGSDYPRSNEILQSCP
jgi:Polysaccharide deacetylase